MPVSKSLINLRNFIAEECGISDPDAVWITDPDQDRMKVFIWTRKLKPKEFSKLTGHRTTGGNLSMRGKIQRILADFNADGFMTRVCPKEAQPHDMFPLTSLTDRKFCSECHSELITGAEEYVGKCELCLPK